MAQAAAVWRLNYPIAIFKGVSNLAGLYTLIQSKGVLRREQHCQRSDAVCIDTGPVQYEACKDVIVRSKSASCAIYPHLHRDEVYITGPLVK